MEQDGGSGDALQSGSHDDPTACTPVGGALGLRSFIVGLVAVTLDGGRDHDSKHSGGTYGRRCRGLKRAAGRSRRWARLSSRLELALSGLHAALKSMRSDPRRTALGRLSTLARAELLRFMEGGRPCRNAGAQPLPVERPPLAAKWAAPLRSPKAGASGRGRRKLRAASPPKGPNRSQPEREMGHRGVRKTHDGVFQAWVCFERLLVKSPAVTSMQKALRFRDVLEQLRDLTTDPPATGGGGAGGGLRGRLMRALAAVFGGTAAEVDLHQETLRYSTYVSAHSWVGRLDTPTTGSLEQVLDWHQRLSCARAAGWPQLRAAWISLLQEGRWLPRGSRGARDHMGPAAARALVDAAWRRKEAHRCRLAVAGVRRERLEVLRLARVQERGAQRAEAALDRAARRASTTVESLLRAALDEPRCGKRARVGGRGKPQPLLRQRFCVPVAPVPELPVVPAF